MKVDHIEVDLYGPNHPDPAVLIAWLDSKECEWIDRPAGHVLGGPAVSGPFELTWTVSDWAEGDKEFQVEHVYHEVLECDVPNGERFVLWCPTPDDRRLYAWEGPKSALKETMGRLDSDYARYGKAEASRILKKEAESLVERAVGAGVSREDLMDIVNDAIVKSVMVS